MYPRHRIVRNLRTGLTTVTAATRGKDGVLNGAAGDLLSQVASGSQTLGSLSSAHPSFFQSCLDNGWLQGTGLQGTFTAVDCEYPLTRLQIELTRHCNLKCSYCYSFSGPWQSGGLSIERVVTYLRDAAELGCVTVDFTGGEPLLYKPWREAVSEARRLGLVVTIHTNGTACNAANLRALALLDIKRLQVSFDSHIPEVHDRVRGQVGAFARSARAVREAKDLGLRVRVVLMAHKYNLDTIGESVAWFSQTLGVKVALDRIVPTGGELTARCGVTAAEYYNAISPLLSRRIPEQRICSPGEFSGVVPHCGVAHSLAYITADDEIALCPTMTSREIPEIAKNLATGQTLRSAWLTSEQFSKLRGLNCENLGRCPTATKCGGGCRSNAYAESGRLEAPDLVACNINKNPGSTFLNFDRLYQIGDFRIPG